MKLSLVLEELEKLAPTAYAEGFDNVGLLVGDPAAEISKILVTLDTLETVVDEAIEKGANLIISFHPIVFSGLKKITGKTYVERVVQKAIKHDINIYATHTALDNAWLGVNHQIAQQLKLKHTEILLPQKSTLQQLVTYVPVEFAAALRQSLFEAGAGKIGNYDQCSFNVEGKGTFRGGVHSNPKIGSINEFRTENEVRISVLVPKHLKGEILDALMKNEFYEEIAYELIDLNNENQHIGMGMIGELEEAMEEVEFLNYLKENMQTEMVRHSQLLGKKVKKIAVLGGSGSFAIQNALQKGADVFVTADLKYHDFFQAEDRILLADIGHYESEQFTKNLLTAYLSEKFPNFAVLKSEIDTNPVHYT
ncbi:MAG TPA: Nif3-like dinuclear metal center hexameric protein [Moheibacter sp.]|nr:Nif3-like dinuclear metal center hexameric protein [Moheibacter sp.]